MFFQVGPMQSSLGIGWKGVSRVDADISDLLLIDWDEISAWVVSTLLRRINADFEGLILHVCKGGRS